MLEKKTLIGLCNLIAKERFQNSFRLYCNKFFINYNTLCLK